MIRRRFLLFAVLILAVPAVFLLWPADSIDSPAYYELQDSNSRLVNSVVPTPVEPNFSQGAQEVQVRSETDRQTDSLRLPRDERSRLIRRLVKKGLPVVPNFRRTVKERIQNKTIRQMVEEIGDIWAATGISEGIAMDFTDPAWLIWSFKQNLRVKRLIEEGRKRPEVVGPMVSADMTRRTGEWVDTVKAYNEALKENESVGFAVSNDGEAIGSGICQKFAEDQYAIVADMFIVMNIGYGKGLQSLAELFHWQLTPVTETVMTPEGPVEAIVLGRERIGPKERINNDILFFAAASLLQNSTDKRHAEAQTALRRLLKGRPLCKEVITDSPEALWPQGDPIIAMSGVDTSSEPSMTLLVPNTGIMGDLEQWHFDKGKVLCPLMEAYKGTTSSDRESHN